MSDNSQDVQFIQVEKYVSEAKFQKCGEGGKGKKLDLARQMVKDIS